MHLIFGIIAVGVLLVASIRRPLVGLLAMIAALQLEYFFMGMLPPGVTLGRLAGFFALVGWLANRRRYRPSELLAAPSLVLPAATFLMVAMIGGLLAKDMSSALSMTIRVGMLMSLGVMVGELINSRRDLSLLCWVTVLSAGVGALAVLLQFRAYQEGAEVIGNVYNARLGVRFEGLTSSANSLGIHLLSGIPFLFCLFFASRAGWVRLACIGLLGLSAFVLVLTVSRSNIYPVAVYVAVSYLLHRRIGRHFIAENAVIAVAVLTLAVAFAMSSDYARERIARPVVELEADSSFAARMDIMRQGLRILNIQPIQGVGLSNTRQYLMRKDAHDTLSALLGETGLVGSLAFALFFIAVARRQRGLLARARATGDPFLQELAIALMATCFVLLVWLPVKVVFYQRLFWLWAGLVVWMDARLPVPARAGGMPFPQQKWLPLAAAPRMATAGKGADHG